MRGEWLEHRDRGVRCARQAPEREALAREALRAAGCERVA